MTRTKGMTRHVKMRRGQTRDGREVKNMIFLKMLLCLKNKLLSLVDDFERFFAHTHNRERPTTLVFQSYRICLTHNITLSLKVSAFFTLVFVCSIHSSLLTSCLSVNSLPLDSCLFSRFSSYFRDRPNEIP